ncbi:MAG: permease-like cell division protein FtsX [Candidatus Eisenbacteria bacterium]|nr:permease-like cell division protein FtsX [Candidatus Eisenbacteria bacterium]
MYSLREVFRDIRRNSALILSGFLATTASLAVLGVFSLVSHNVLRIVKLVEQRKEIVVFLKDGVGEERVASVEEELLALQGVKGVEYTSKAQAWTEFVKEMGKEEILKAVGYNPLPASFKLILLSEYKNAARMKVLAGQVMRIGGVEDVSYGGEWIERLDRIVRVLLLGTLIVGVFVGLSVVVVMASTTRFIVLARRDMVEILKSVGASDSAIRRSFLIEGASLSFLSSCLAMVVVFLGFRALHNSLPDVEFLEPIHVLIFVGLGTFLGLCGSYLSVRGVLKNIE